MLQQAAVEYGQRQPLRAIAPCSFQAPEDSCQPVVRMGARKDDT
jgi:hypothetical protein